MVDNNLCSVESRRERESKPVDDTSPFKKNPVVDSHVSESLQLRQRGSINGLILSLLT